MPGTALMSSATCSAPALLEVRSGRPVRKQAERVRSRRDARHHVGRVVAYEQGARRIHAQ